MKTAVYRRARFNAAHRLHNPVLSDEENAKLFGKCNNAHYHGHNYVLIVKVVGELDPVTGFVVDLKWLKELIKEHVTDRFDHKNLNLDTEEFKEVNPTAENIAKVCYQILRKHVGQELELQVRLFETENNYVEYPA
ncbi:MAG: 6-carboxytetrahydropterin synthase [Cytophagales bacterium]|nr:6-carboxytetrahydropterin synthase [Cytophagales bacterium]